MTKPPVAAGGFAAASPTTARARPVYARRAIGLVKESCPRGGHLVDVAAGTGILAGQLSRAVVRVTAVEPVAAEVAHLRRALPEVAAVRAVAAALPFAPSSVDVLTVSRGFHRLAPGDALAEAARVLHPGGLLAQLWNESDRSTPWVRALAELVESRGLGSADEHESDRAEVVTTSGLFDEVQIDRFAHSFATTAAGVLDRVRRTGAVAAMEPDDRDRLLVEVAELLHRHEPLGTFEHPHHTVVLRCRSTGEP